MSPAIQADEPIEMVKPFVWLAVTGFLIGFVLCLALSFGHLAASREAARAGLRPLVGPSVEPAATVDEATWRGERIT